jgi:tetratricopeptide (TPR) repeat protein
MRPHHLSVVVLLLIAGLNPCFAQENNVYSDCVEVKETDQKIASRTRIIENKNEDIDDRIVAYSTRGREFFLKEEFDRAPYDYDEAIKLKPRHPSVTNEWVSDAYNERGLIQVFRNNLDLAVVEFDRSIQIEPSSRAYSNRGNIRFLNTDLDGAAEDFGEAIRYDHDIPYAAVARARAYGLQGDYESAKSSYDHALALNPVYIAAYLGRGAINLLDNQIDPAMVDYDEGVRIAPNDALIHAARGVARQAKGNLDGAIADYTEAIRLNKDLGLAYFGRGTVYLAKGDNDQANRDFEQAAKLDQNLQQCRQMFGGDLREIQVNLLREIDNKICFGVMPPEMLRDHLNLLNRENPI